MTAAVVPLPRRERRAAARLFGDAFVDDPGWTAIGPNGTRRRRAYARRICGGELRFAERAGGFVLCTHDSGRLSGVLIGYPAGVLPLPWWTIFYGLPGALAAGVPVLRRSLAAQTKLELGHPVEPHLFVSLLAVSPAFQRGGRGRALLSEAIARAVEAEVPLYLDTANPANVPYYRSFGFVETGKATLPRGAPLWYLLRPAATAP